MSSSKLYINGQWQAPVKGASFTTINPATEEVIQEIAEASQEDVALAVSAAKQALTGEWGNTTGAQRAQWLEKIAAEIELRHAELAKIETIDNGKTLGESEADVADSVACFRYYAQLAKELDAKQNTLIDIGEVPFKCRLQYSPIGVVGQIIPWNYPLLMAAWKVAPALAAGTTIILKPSEYTPLSALILAEICDSIKLPKGVINILTGRGQATGEPLSFHPEVHKLAFTGSVATGKKIFQAASQDIKNVTLELGGKSAIIVFADADIEKAVEWIMFGIFLNQGQICSATSRLLVHENIAEALLQRLKVEAEKITIGPGLNEGILLGPLVSENQYRKVLQFIEQGKQQAKLLTGGKRPEHLPKGYFLEPTVFVVEDTQASIWQEEIFGPVLAVKTFRDEQQAVELANASKFGLAAAVISQDNSRAERVASKLQAGIVWINCSQPTFIQAPWGGCKQSGIGRELGHWGLDNYLEVKQLTSYESTDPWGYYIK